MQSTVRRVFKELQKYGMTAAFYQKGNKEYIHPPVKKNGSPFGLIIAVAAGAALVLGLLFFIGPFNGTSGTTSAPVQPTQSTQSTQSAQTAQTAQTTLKKNIPSSPLRFGLTPLHHAVIGNDATAVQGFIEQGATIDAPDHYGWTPLHWAAFCGHHDIYRLLVRSGASQTAQSSRSWFIYPSGITAPQTAQLQERKKIKIY